MSKATTLRSALRYERPESLAHFYDVLIAPPKWMRSMSPDAQGATVVGVMVCGFIFALTTVVTPLMGVLFPTWSDFATVLAAMPLTLISFAGLCWALHKRRRRRIEAELASLPYAERKALAQSVMEFSRGLSVEALISDADRVAMELADAEYRLEYLAIQLKEFQFRLRMVSARLLSEDLSAIESALGYLVGDNDDMESGKTLAAHQKRLEDLCQQITNLNSPLRNERGLAAGLDKLATI